MHPLPMMVAGHRPNRPRTGGGRMDPGAVTLATLSGAIGVAIGALASWAVTRHYCLRIGEDLEAAIRLALNRDKVIQPALNVRGRAARTRGWDVGVDPEGNVTRISRDGASTTPPAAEAEETA